MATMSSEFVTTTETVASRTTPLLSLLSAHHNLVNAATNAQGDQLVVFTKYIPMTLFDRYVAAVAQQVNCVCEDNHFYCDAIGFSGVWGEGDSAEAALNDFREALEEWVLIKVEDGDKDLPVVAGIDLNVL